MPHTNVLAKVCNNCKSGMADRRIRTSSAAHLTLIGIPYDVQYSFCTFCQVFFCSSCAEQHTSLHISHLIQMTSKLPSPHLSTQDLYQCATCSTTALAGFNCRDCKVHYCRNCFEWQCSEHRHRSYTAFEAPFHSIKTATNGATVPCCTKPAISHCSRCLTRRLEKTR